MSHVAQNILLSRTLCTFMDLSINHHPLGRGGAGEATLMRGENYTDLWV